MQNKKIVIVEDDLKLAKLMKDYLSNHSYTVFVEHQGDKGLYRIIKEQPDLVLLDFMLPKMDGVHVCREARQYFNGLILMLTANDEDEVQIESLESGADDFVRKPIDPRVLLARVEALLRRRQGVVQPVVLEVGQLKLDPSKQTAYLQGEYLGLSGKEFQLLYFLTDHAGQVVTRDQILQSLKGFDYDGVSRVIDILVVSLRKKLKDDGREPKYIKTVWGKGYLFVKEAFSAC